MSPEIENLLLWDLTEAKLEVEKAEEKVGQIEGRLREYFEPLVRAFEGEWNAFYRGLEKKYPGVRNYEYRTLYRYVVHIYSCVELEITLLDDYQHETMFFPIGAFNSEEGKKKFMGEVEREFEEADSAEKKRRATKLEAEIESLKLELERAKNA